MPIAAVIPQPNHAVELREIPLPDLELNSAVLAVELSEVCGTDVYLQRGLLAGVPYPLIPGHVSVGRLEKIQGHMKDVNGKDFSEGDRVTFLDVHRTCNACWYCLVAKATTRCPQRKVYGITYGTEDGPSGGWASQIYLKPGTICLRLETEPELFMAGGCALPTALHAVERAEIRLGETVLVLGSGPVGLNVILLSLLRGASQVFCIGAPAHRLDAALSAGATGVLNFQEHSESDCVDWLRDKGPTGILPDVTIEATGDPDAVIQAMRYTRDAGRVVVVGQYTDHGPVSTKVAFNPHLDLNKKHLDIHGCWGSDFSHFYRAVQLVSDPRHSSSWTKLQPNLSRFTLNQANEALAAVASAGVLKALIDPRA
ncbi:MAG TPA: zinc-binding dehydrogenase [Pyrinomonadaceae bacterium]|jgi:L-iditol 2-dehydrogenase